MATNPQLQASTGIALSTPATPDLRCKYANKVCCKERARKTNGTLHSLCEEHRARANSNQQRYRDNCKRQRKIQDQLLEPYSAPAGVFFDQDDLQFLIEWVFERSDMTSGDSTGTGV